MNEHTRIMDEFCIPPPMNIEFAEDRQTLALAQSRDPFNGLVLSLSPIKSEPIISQQRITRLWDMLKLDTRTFISAMTYLSGTVADFRNLIRSQGRIAGSLPVDGRAQIIGAIIKVRETCELHDLTASARQASYCEARCTDLLGQELGSPLSQNVLISVSGAIEGLLNSVIHEAEGREFYAVPPKAGSHPEGADDLFGEAVVDAFPDAAFDIEEAGKALYFGLWTAAVMHTMRALETTLRPLAAHVGVEHRENWNQTLNAIETALRQVRKSESGDEAESWAAEAGTHLRFVKNAWRNQTMHPVRTFDETQARSIFANARDFMQHIAERLRDADDVP